MQKIYTKELRPKPVPLIVEGGVIDEEDVGIFNFLPYHDPPTNMTYKRVFTFI
ncbi:hypothetical protein HanHA300_Chr09g0321431 [Helianthus annuus]|nr:hypothetical protein HanHA300_Chr09g0321431 [Helianthus annuus]